MMWERQKPSNSSMISATKAFSYRIRKENRLSISTVQHIRNQSKGNCTLIAS